MCCVVLCAGVGSKDRLTYSEFVEFCLVVAMLNDEDIIKCTTTTHLTLPCGPSRERHTSGGHMHALYHRHRPTVTCVRERGAASLREARGKGTNVGLSVIVVRRVSAVRHG